MRTTLTLLALSTTLGAAGSLPAAAAFCSADLCARVITLSEAPAEQPLPLILASGDDDDDEGEGYGRGGDDDDDDCEGDDDDGGCGGQARNPAPAGTAAPPANGLFGTGAAPKVQMN